MRSDVIFYFYFLLTYLKTHLALHGCHQMLLSFIFFLSSFFYFGHTWRCTDAISSSKDCSIANTSISECKQTKYFTFFFKKKCSKDCAMAHIYHDASVKIQQINNNHKKKLKVFLPAQWPTPLSASVPTHYVPLPERVRERVRGRALEFARDLSL